MKFIKVLPPFCLRPFSVPILFSVMLTLATDSKGQTPPVPSTKVSSSEYNFPSNSDCNCLYGYTVSKVSLNGNQNYAFDLIPGDSFSLSFSYDMNISGNPACLTCKPPKWYVWSESADSTVFNKGKSTKVSLTFAVPNKGGDYYIVFGPAGSYTNSINQAMAVISVMETTSSVWIQKGNNIYYNSGNVGIGLTSPSSALDIDGAISVKGNKVISSGGKWLGSKSGLKGPAGSPGSQWYVGAGKPAKSLGARSDLYLDTTTANVYRHTQNHWQLVGNIQGAAGKTGKRGPKGASGASWFTGAGKPVDSIGSENDLYLDTTSANVYQRAKKNWQLVENLQGVQGKNGSDGATWLTGKGSPSKSKGNNADLYLDTTTANVYKKNKGVWSLIENIQGPKGPKGEQGPPGEKGPKGNCECSTTAELYAIAAAGAAGTAGTAATEATDAAAEATTAAAEASESAVGASRASTKASNSESNAKNYASTAKVQKDSAQNSARNAKTSASQASSYKDSAQIAAQQAKKTMDSKAGGDVSGKYPDLTVIKIQNNPISDEAPKTNQVLTWSGTKWTPGTGSVDYSAGTGIEVNDSLISALNDSSLWNASKLMGSALSDSSPSKGQVLMWTHKKWSPTTLVIPASNWAVNTTSEDSVLYTEFPGNVGVNTSTPTYKFQIQGGQTNASDSSFYVSHSGSVGIGTLSSDTSYKLMVNGGIRTKKITVETGWADYVFKPTYVLRPLDSVAEFIAKNGHLPGIKSEQEIVSKGLDLGSMQVQMMEKIEELTLYMIALKEENDQLRRELNALMTKLED
ncbi:MAG: hypothetical protein JJ975_10790 [Bacteroidia bacterium]|nr:hypothetical protein [Bacteroidia bacterium]